MGQYYIVVNLDKEQYLSPHAFGDGAKLLEFGQSARGALFGLAVLLADGNGRGGGDVDIDNPLVGSWAGDKIVITGDYADQGKFLPESPKNMAKRLKGPNCNLYAYATEHFEDISDDIVEMLLEYLRLNEEEWEKMKERKEQL